MGVGYDRKEKENACIEERRIYSELRAETPRCLSQYRAESRDSHPYWAFSIPYSLQCPQSGRKRTVFSDRCMLLHTLWDERDTSAARSPAGIRLALAAGQED